MTIRRAGREGPLVGDRGDTLQVLRVEPLEQRHAPKLEHPLDLAEARVRAGHRPSVARAPCRQRPDPRVVIMPQGVEHVVVGIGDGPDRIELDEPRDGPPEPPIADRIERLDRLRTDVGIVRSKAAADDPARLRHVEDGERVEREILMAPPTLLQDVARGTRIRSRCAAPASRERLAARLIARSTWPSAQATVRRGPRSRGRSSRAPQPPGPLGRARRDGRPRRRQRPCRRPADRRRHCGRDGSDPRARTQQPVGAANVCRHRAVEDGGRADGAASSS